MLSEGAFWAPSGNPLLSEPVLRTLLRTLFYCKTHSKPPSKDPSENPFPEPFPEPFLERRVAVRPLRLAPEICTGCIHLLKCYFFLKPDQKPEACRTPYRKTSGRDSGKDRRPGSGGFKKLSEFTNSSFQEYESSQNTCFTVLRCNQRGADDP